MTFPNMNTLIDANAELGAALVDARVERDALAERVEKLEAALKAVERWFEQDEHDSMIYKIVCEALKGK